MLPKREFRVMIEEDRGERVFCNTFAASKKQAENFARHRYCMDKFAEEASRQVLAEAGITFRAERVATPLKLNRLPKLLQPLLPGIGADLSAFTR